VKLWGEVWGVKGGPKSIRIAEYQGQARKDAGATQASDAAEVTVKGEARNQGNSKRVESRMEKILGRLGTASKITRKTCGTEASKGKTIWDARG